MPNSIADNLQRLINAKTAIASAITEKGGTVESGDGFEEFAADIATIVGGGGSDFLGSFLLLHDRFNVNLNDKELVYNQSSATTNNISGYIAPVTIMHYNGAWEWCITYRPRFSTSTVCILGTASSGRYYENPTIELTGLTSIWIGITTTTSTWETGFTLSDFSESMTIGTAYSFILGSDSEGNGYAKLINADSGAILASDSKTGIFQHHNSGNYRTALLGNAMQSRFMLAGDIVLSKTYYKEDGEILWGGEQQTQIKYSGSFTSPLRVWDTLFVDVGFAPKVVAVWAYDDVNDLNTYSVVYGITNGDQNGYYFQDGGFTRAYAADNTSGSAQTRKGHIIGTSENGFTFQVCETYFANKLVKFIAIGVENNL